MLSRERAGPFTSSFNACHPRRVLLTQLHPGGYVTGSPGIGPHGFRRLVASEFLRRNAQPYHLVAEVLNDELSAVMRCYARLRRDDSFSHHEAHIDALLAADRV